MSPEYERNLKEELWGCFKHIGFSMEELLKMPRRDRKMYIQMHNMDVKKDRNTFTDRDFKKSMQPNAALRKRTR